MVLGLRTSTCLQWHLTPVLLPGKSHGWRSLEDCSPWGHWGSDTTEQLHFHFSLSCIGEGNGNPLQCSCLENPRDGGAWWAAVYGVAQSRTRLKWLSSRVQFNPLYFICLLSDSLPTLSVSQVTDPSNLHFPDSLDKLVSGQFQLIGGISEGCTVGGGKKFGCFFPFFLGFEQSLHQ